MRFDLLIGGGDKGYLDAFVRFLTDSNNHQFNITHCDNLESARAHLGAKKFDLCLIEEGLFMVLEPHIPEGLSPSVLVLTETYTDIDTRKYKPVLKYQHAGSIEALLVAHFLSHTKKEVVTGAVGRGKCVACFGPSGGAGTTTVAQIFAVQKARKGYKVLYISMEDFQSHDRLFHGLKDRNLSDCLAHMMTESNWFLGLKEMVSEDLTTGVHFLRSPNNGKDLTELPHGLWGEWLEYIAEMGDYDYRVVDLGNRLFTGGLEILINSDHRIYVNRMDKVAEHKWAKFQADVRALTEVDLFERSTVVCRQLDEGGGFRDICDIVLQTDEHLYETTRDGSLKFNSAATTYRRIEELTSHV